MHPLRRVPSLLVRFFLVHPASGFSNQVSIFNKGKAPIESSVSNSFRNRIFMQPNETAQHASKQVHLFPFRGRGETGGGVWSSNFLGFFCSHHVLILFSQVPHDVPHEVPNSTKLYPTFFAQVVLS